MQSIKYAVAFIAITLLGVSLAGCNTLRPPRDCKSAKLDVAPYTIGAQGVRAEPLARGTRVAVRSYKMTAASTRVWPCTQLELKKEVALQREANAKLVIKEIREVYAEDGTLIVKAVDDVSRQLSRTGMYTAVLALPIPQQAPAGKYRVVTKLLMEAEGQKSLPLGQTSTAFTVMSDDTMASESSKPSVLHSGRRPHNPKNSAP